MSNKAVNARLQGMYRDLNAAYAVLATLVDVIIMIHQDESLTDDEQERMDVYTARLREYRDWLSDTIDRLTKEETDAPPATR